MLTFEPPNAIVVSPKEFLEMERLHGRDILSARVIPPRLGSKGFGAVRVVVTPRLLVESILPKLR